MDRFLSLSPDDRALAFEQAATRRGLPQTSVEKDCWVCLMLRELFALPGIGEHLTFKGGTSLSKAWGLIDRFSEDIDLTIDRDILGFGGKAGPDRAQSGNEQQRRLRGLKKACREMVEATIAPELKARVGTVLPAGEPWGLTSDEEDPDRQTLLFAYPRRVDAGIPAYVKPVVKLEFGARSDPWPVDQREVTSIVAEEFPALFDSTSCAVRALRPERTFWEKVMLLHEETFRPAGKAQRPRMARHYYDVWRLIEAGVARTAAADTGLFNQVAAHRRLYFKHSWVDYDTQRRGAIDMMPRPDQAEAWRQDYSAMQADMFVGTPPRFDEILASIARFQSEFNSS